MSDIVERLHTLARGDHDRNCQGREYHCGCGFDEQAWQAADEAADTIIRLRVELSEARAKAFEEAAEVCEEERLCDYTQDATDAAYDKAVARCAQAIRAMIDKV